MGGEITWTCIKGGPDVGKYIFKMIVYKDCSGSGIFSTTGQTLDHHNYPTVGQQSPILLNFVGSNTFATPVGSPSSGNSCFDCPSMDEGAVEEYIWESDPTTLAGSPPPEGWHFTWGTCCRNATIDNIVDPDLQDWTLRAVMYPYLDPITGVNLPADPCYDSSPEFKELARTIICTGYPFKYSHNASDEELDEITYSWSEPLNENVLYNPSNPSATALPFIPPYTYDSPLPGIPTIDSQTGEIAYYATIEGAFVTCVKVEAKRCGQVVAEVYREVQVMLVDCSIYNQPTDGFNDPPIISEPFPGTPTPYELIVYAGDLVTFNIEAKDDDIYTGGGTQNVTLTVSGGQFAFDPLLQQLSLNTTLCPNPPCATFQDGSGTVAPLIGASIVNGVFEWQTHCDHITNEIGCNATSNIFTFSIKAYDDFCPANGISIATIKITVVPPIPDFRCVSVDGDGDIELTWEYDSLAPPTNEPVFIWHSTSFAGPYTELDSVSYPINTYTHIGADGDNASQYYYLSNTEGCDASGSGLYSDTLQSIFMDVTPINLGMSANLDWNAIHDPLLITSEIDYDMYIKKPNTSFYNYLTTSLSSYLYNADKCQDDLQVYVEIADASSCVSRSSIGIANLGDTITPIRTTINNVSVNANGHAVISWNPSPGTYDYEVYIQDDLNNSGWNKIGTVLDPDTTFIYTASNAADYSETFSVRALDTCDNSKDRSLPHNSIHLSADLDECTHDLTLSWNQYINWNNGVGFYHVVVEETDLSGLTIITKINLIDTSRYIVAGLKDKYSYKIYVEANDSDTIFSALSNQLVLTADLPKKPEYNYIDYASINHDNGFVEINCLVDNSAIIDHYDVMRSLRETNSFSKIGEIPFLGETTIHYTDEFTKTSDEFYQYKIFPVDTCGVILFAPPINTPEYHNDTSFAQTILLETFINLDYSSIDPSLENEYTNTIRFNEYDKWLGSVSEYRLYRSINKEPFNLIPLYTWDRIYSPNEELKFIDVVTEYGDENGSFCYYIEAIEGNTSPYGSVIEGSFSNISCVLQIPKIFVPSVFTPNGDEHNEIFHPITYFVSENGYSFKIYSRNGSVIFSTNDPTKGWDGTFKGSTVQDGNYVYQLQYINSEGNLIEKTAIITIVR